MGEVRFSGSSRHGAPCGSPRPRWRPPGRRRPFRKVALGVLGGCGFLLGLVPASAIAIPDRLDPVRPTERAPAPASPDGASPALVEAIRGARLRASDGAAYDQFGHSVAVSGDTAVVGAHGDDTPAGTNAGSAYVFVRSGNAWTQQAKLVASDGAAGGNFGSSVAVGGDTALVGAHGDGTAGGSAYVFVRSGNTWTEQAKLTASDGAFGDRFGVSVALHGDTAVVGARFDDTPAGEDAGSAYVFARSGTTWTEQAHLTAPDGAASDYFGSSVAASEDTAVVGAYADDSPAGADTGSAYVFVRSGTAWTGQAKLNALDWGAGDYFGSSVAVSGDTAVVGAYGYDTPAVYDAGSAHVFVRSGTAWTERAKLTAPDGTSEDRFGYSVAVSDDTAAVGAYYDDTPSGYHAGSAYVAWRE